MNNEPGKAMLIIGKIIVVCLFIVIVYFVAQEMFVQNVEPQF